MAAGPYQIHTCIRVICGSIRDLISVMAILILELGAIMYTIIKTNNLVTKVLCRDRPQKSQSQYEARTW